VEEAWNELAPQLAADEQATRESAKGVVPLAGGLLIVLGLVTATFVIQSFRNALRIQQTNPDAGKGSATLVFVVGGLIALGFLLLGAVYLMRASRSDRRTRIS
jgi:UDP-N-acetylmuramyl pentapeptide phosphotransferase/UDP-N-acetylglucosamine-1-phosphate transferase